MAAGVRAAGGEKEACPPRHTATTRNMPNDKLPAPLSGSLPALGSPIARSSLDDRLEATKLTPEEIATEAAKGVQKATMDALLGLLPGSEAVKAILSVASDTNEALRQKKLEILLARFFNKTENTEETVLKIGKLVTDPWGGALFSKIVRIVEDNPPDGDLLNHLANALNYIAHSDYRALFSRHKFALAQIEQLTPQALTLIADHANWPKWLGRGIMVANGIVTSPWGEEFGAHYARAAIFDDEEKRRLVHVAHDLRSRGFAEAVTQQAPTGESIVSPRLTSIARELVSYIS